MKKGITILFILTTIAFCALLYFILFYADHHGKKLLIIALVIGLIVTAALLVWLYNKYITLTLHKGNSGKTQMLS